MRRLAICLCGFLVGCATAPYPIEDFRALVKQESWSELFTSLAAVAPAKRDDQWADFLATAAAGELKTFDVERNPEGAIDSADQMLKQYPVLKRSKVFMGQRAETGLRALRLTYGKYRHAASDDEWLPQVKAFVEKDTVTPGLAQRAAKEVVLTRLIPEVAFPLYQLAFERDGDAVCGDAELPRVMLGVVEDGAWMEEAKGIVATRCFAQLKGPFTEALTKGENRHLVKYSCKLLADKAELAEVLKTACAR